MKLTREAFIMIIATISFGCGKKIDSNVVGEYHLETGLACVYKGIDDIVITKNNLKIVTNRERAESSSKLPVTREIRDKVDELGILSKDVDIELKIEGENEQSSLAKDWDSSTLDSNKLLFTKILHIKTTSGEIVSLYHDGGQRIGINGGCVFRSVRTGSSLNSPAIKSNSTSTPLATSSPPITAAKDSENSLLEQASKCSDIDSCITFMLKGAETRKLEVIQLAAARIADFPKPGKGDRKAARDYNKKGLEGFKKNNFNEAITQFKLGVEKDKRDVELQGNLGFALVKANQGVDAEQELKSALLLDPKRTSTWLPMAEAYDQQGKKDLAVNALLIAYEFSGNKEKTVAVYTDKSTTDDKESMKGVYAAALQKIKNPDSLR